MIAKYDGHTHIYQYSPDDTDRLVRMIKLHTEEGQLHPYAALMLVSLGRKYERDD